MPRYCLEKGVICIYANRCGKCTLFNGSFCLRSDETDTETEYLDEE